MLGKAGLKKGTAFIKKRLPLSFYASNESKSVLARDLGDCRDNLRNTRSVFLIVGGKVIKNWEGTADYEKQFPPRPCIKSKKCVQCYL